VSLTVMAILFVSELSSYLSSTVRPELYVDTTLGSHLQINFDVIFHHIPCSFVSVNAMDKAGNHQLNIHHDVFTTRLDTHGIPVNDVPEKEVVGEDKHTADVKLNETESGCGDCYGAESEQIKCCNTCELVQEAYRAKGWAFTDAAKIKQCVKEGYMEKLVKQKDEGCRIHGILHVARVGGNVNIVPGKFIVQNSRYVVDSNLYQFAGGFNLSHTIKKLTFGEEFPGMQNPLDGTKMIWGEAEGSPMYEYFLSVVPTVYEYLNGTTLYTNQFSVTEYSEKIQKDENTNLHRGVPGLFFMYELSPITIDFKQTSKSILHFLTNLCAIIGGIFTVASLFDTLVFRGLSSLKVKQALGKDT